VPNIVIAGSSNKVEVSNAAKHGPSSISIKLDDASNNPPTKGAG
jgi:hypothetical protein